jgi:hypothetical protein
MQLTPPVYECATHQQDLTELVEEQLDVTFPGVYTLLSVRGAKNRERPFRVIVKCPGRGTPHDVACTGTAQS